MESIFTQDPYGIYSVFEQPVKLPMTCFVPRADLMIRQRGFTFKPVPGVVSRNLSGLTRFYGR